MTYRQLNFALRAFNKRIRIHTGKKTMADVTAEGEVKDLMNMMRGK